MANNPIKIKEWKISPKTSQKILDHCTICKKSGHTNNQCRFRQTRIKQPYQRSRSRVEAHLAEEISEDESYPTETKGFLAKALTARITTKQKSDNTVL